MADLTITAANVIAGGDTVALDANAAVAIAAGEIVYRNASGLWALADANVTATEAAAIGMAVNTAAIGQHLRVVTKGTVTIGTGTAGQPYVVSINAGKLAPEADIAPTQWWKFIGVGLSTTQIYIDAGIPAVQHV